MKIAFFALYRKVFAAKTQTLTSYNTRTYVYIL